MMIVPRQYARSPPRKTRSSDLNEKNTYRSTRSPSNAARSVSPLSSSTARSPSITLIAPSKGSIPRSQPKANNVPERPQSTPLPSNEVPRFRRESTKDLLSSTAIPIRRRPKGRLSQRLPRGDVVADFSRLIMDDVKSTNGTNAGGLPRSVSNSNFDGLFGNMDELLEEGQMYVGSEGLDSGILSTRSMSEESLLSMPSYDEYNASDRNSQHSSHSQSFPERKIRQAATSEDCSDDHPLSLPNDEDAFFMYSPDAPSSPMGPTQKLPGNTENRSRSPLSLKSSLTASLKALKSAAQSVSTRSIMNSSNRTDSPARSFFDFHPALTDDRRPPSSFESPTPELRRYLNPPPLDSAAQLHFWQDHRQSKFNPPLPPKKLPKRVPKHKKSPLLIDGNSSLTRDLPPIVQLADCLPPSIRTEHASSPPIWLTRDGTPVNKNTSIPLLFDPDANNGKGEPAARHREPRENRDFLRVFVCEMAMRRNGKLSDDLSTGRARLWLPPVDSGNGAKHKNQASTGPNSAGNSSAGCSTRQSRGANKSEAASPKVVSKRRKEGSERLMCLSIEDV